MLANVQETLPNLFPVDPRQRQGIFLSGLQRPSLEALPKGSPRREVATVLESRGTREEGTSDCCTHQKGSGGAEAFGLRPCR
jgi:hypothetical protein